MAEAALTLGTRRAVVVPRLAGILALTLLALIAVSGVQLLDPMVRHDDFPALLADPTEFWAKTLSEGRWLNWLWHLRPVAGPAPLHYLLYLAAWATFCAAAAVNALGRDAPLWQPVALSLLIAVGPPAILISLWFNTLIPGLALVALFAVLSTRLSERASRALLLVFVPATLMAYTTYPLLLLMICLTRHGGRRGAGDLLGLLALFAASFALGLVLIYGLNYAVHGVFGIEVAAWRAPTPAHDLASAAANLALFADFLGKAALDMAYRSSAILAFHLAGFAGGIAVLLRQDRWAALCILAGCAAGLGLIALQTVLNGIATPTRAAGFLWMAHAIVFVRLVALAGVGGGVTARTLRIALIAVVAVYAMQGAHHYRRFSDWQAETRALAASVSPGAGPVYVEGDYRTLPGAEAAGIQAARGLRLRLRYLTGERFVVCTESPGACAAAMPGAPRLLILPGT